MRAILKDLVYAWRGIRRNPAPSLAVVLTLALGIGPVTAVFSTVYGVLMRPLPYEAAGELVRLRQPSPDGTTGIGFNIPELTDYTTRTQSVAALVEYHSLWFNLIEVDEPTRVQTGVVSWNYFDVLGVRPLHGRGFRATDDEVGAPRVLVLSNEYWQRKYGGDPGVVGRVVTMNQQPHTIVGVLPKIPRYPNSNDDVYMPGSACPFRTPAWLNNRQARAVTVFGRLKPGVSIERARNELAATQQALKAEFPQSFPPNRSFGISATPLHEELTAGAQTTLLLVFGTAAFLLLIVCANVANLTLARALGRDRELAVMTALGAPQSVIARQMLTESTVLSLAGGALGVGLAYATSGLLANFAARFSPRANDVSIDAPVLLFALAASVVMGVILGAIPAWPKKRDLGAALREGQKGSGAGIRARSALVVGQVALAFVLLTGAGLMIRSLVRLQSQETGFEAASVLTMRIDLDFSRYTPQGRARAGLTDSGPSPAAFWSRLLDEMQRDPSVQSRGLAANVPFGGGLPQLQFAIRGRDADAAANVTWNIVSDGYVPTAGIRLLAGRDFAPTDQQNAPQVALVSEALAKQYWRGESPIGSFISTGGQNQNNWFEVVGVVSDVRQNGLTQPLTPQAYIPLRQNGSLGSTLMVRTTRDPLASASAIREVVRRVDPNQPVAFVQTLEQARSASVASQRLTTVLLALLAGLALCISAAGIAGVMAYAVSQRTREIGIRIALGAAPVEVRWMVLRQALTLVGVGIVIGGASALFLSRLMSRLLFQATTTDPVTYAAVALVFAAVGLLAAAAPAIRSSAVDPLRALRAE